MYKFLASFSVVGFLLIACASNTPNLDPDPSIADRLNNNRQLALNPGAALQCHELRALIPVGGKLEGPDCIDNKAVINGWSEKCVANGACNTRQRRGELNQEAKSFCADWCAAKRCDFVYTARNACDSAWCLNSRTCQANCNLPLLDTCYFQQAAPNYNCQCVNPPSTDPPIVDG